MESYKGKHVLITGGTSGIGIATAKLLLDGGARVLVTGSADSSLESARQELGPHAIVVRSNTASLADIDNLSERVKSDFAPLDALIVCAGQTRFVPFESVTEQTYDDLFAINAKGTYFTVQKLAPLMREGGAVVLTTSVANVAGLPMISAYAATKAAVRSMTRSMASELLPHGIRVNAVSPGPIDSGILEKAMPKEQSDQTRQQMIESNPMKRFGRPEEVARALVFLAFEATYTTGAELVVDGGGSQL